jgi:soluble lytic murein transglycosylase-like protein
VVAWDLPPSFHYQQCVAEAEQRYQVPGLLIYSVWSKERGVVGKTSKKNRNGSYDIGPMQINSSWLPKLAKFSIDEERLTWDACSNIHVGAWILRSNYVRYGDWTKAIISYNIGTSWVEPKLSIGLKYAQDVLTYWNYFEQKYGI